MPKKPDVRNCCKVINGECLEVLRDEPKDSFDALVTDPPAGIDFMKLDFDSNRGGREPWVAWLTEIAIECLRVLKPGAHALVWALPRTSHWTGMALEDAGFELRDSIHHVFGSGMPKGLSLDKAIDKKLGRKRAVVSRNKTIRRSDSSVWKARSGFNAEFTETTLPASKEAIRWNDWHSAIKPAHEIWWLCRKPLSERSIVDNVLKWGTGALNIGATRVGTHGRFPSNLALTHSSGCTRAKCSADCPVVRLNQQGGRRKSGKLRAGTPLRKSNVYGTPSGTTKESIGDEGYVSRFFPIHYAGKTSPRDRGPGNDHPTVKSIELMRWLCRLVTPPGGKVLDPFAGSGSTGVACLREKFGFLGIEQDAHYCQIAKRRVKSAAQELGNNLAI